MATESLFHAPIGEAYNQTRARFAPVYALLEAAVADRVFPGCAFGVLAEGKIAVLDGVGRQTYDEHAPLITASTVYDLASLTKVVATTAMAMLLYQRGVLDFDRPVADILAGFAHGDARRADVKIRHLLAHNSGLAGYARLFESYATPEALFDACLGMPLEARPGTRTEYSDIGFILLGHLLETLAGEPLDVFCRREIFEPLGMTGTFFRPPAAWKTSIPPTEDDRVFRHRGLQGEVQDENCWILGGVAGHAGLFGDVLDLLRFARALLQPVSGRVFDRETIHLFAQRVEEPAGSSRALGWDTPSPPPSGGPSSSGSSFSANSIGHLGFAGTSIWIDLADECAVVLLSNRCWPSRENQKIKQFRPFFHDAVRGILAVPKAPPCDNDRLGT